MSIADLRERAASLREQMNHTSDPSQHASLQRQLEATTDQIEKDKGDPHSYKYSGGYQTLHQQFNKTDGGIHDKDGVIDVTALEAYKGNIEAGYDRQLNDINSGGDVKDGDIKAGLREANLLGQHISDRNLVEMKISHAENDGTRFTENEKQQMRKEVDKKHTKIMEKDDLLKEAAKPVKETTKSQEQPINPKENPAEKSFADMLKVDEPRGKGIMDAAKEKIGEKVDQVKDKANEMFGKLKEKVNGYVEKVCKDDIEKLPLDNEGKAKGYNIADVAKQSPKDYDKHEQILNTEISKDRESGKLEVSDNHQKEVVKDGINNIKAHDKDMKVIGKEISDQGLRNERFSIDLAKQSPEIRESLQTQIKEMSRNKGPERER